MKIFENAEKGGVVKNYMRNMKDKKIKNFLMRTPGTQKV